MKLEYLEIENIRTYGNARVEFQTGVTLFEGDVGSGKSSLLYAIEFALFGLSDLKAGHLLSHGEPNGSATLALEVNGKSVVIHRKLERKKETARQTPGWISENGVRTEYSPEELKAKMLSILGFRENPSSRAASWIFRYAVFTPQEEMKEILQLGAQERLQTLRKAFGLQEYKIAQEHVGVVLQKFREKARELTGQTMDIAELQDRQEKMSADILDLQKKAKDSERDAIQAKHTQDAMQKKVEDARERALIAERQAGKVPFLEQRVKDLSQHEIELNTEQHSVQRRLTQASQEKEQLEKMRGAPMDDPKAKWESAQAVLAQCQKQLGAAEHAAKEHRELASGTCPTCGQTIPDNMSGKIKNAQVELEKAMTAFRIAQQKEGECREKVNAFNEQKMVVEKIAQKEELKIQLNEQLGSIQLKMSQTKKDQTAALSEFQEKKDQLQAAINAKKELQAAENERLQSQAALSVALSEHAALIAKSEQLMQQLNELAERLKEKTRILKNLKKLEEKNAWLSDPFIPAVAVIEAHVLRKINHEFNRLFSHWFVQLLETQDISAEVDASFTPQIRQQGFEQDYAALSGGEKSALALSYRLALNTLVRQTTPSLKDNLLILDEPTDGFSKEQLSRMRSVLHEAGAQQVLLVSHEKELESLCDQVYLVEKRDGKSTIKEAGS